MDVENFEKNSQSSLQGTRSQTTGDSEPINTCSSVPLDSVRGVAVETTLNPPAAYWPPPSLSSANFFRGVDNDSKMMTSPQNLSFKKTTNRTSKHEELCISIPNNNDRRNAKEFALSVMSPSRGVLHHKLPPIVGITSSRNSRTNCDIIKRRDRPDTSHNMSEWEISQLSGGHHDWSKEQKSSSELRGTQGSSIHAVGENDTPIALASSAASVSVSASPGATPFRTRIGDPHASTPTLIPSLEFHAGPENPRSMQSFPKSPSCSASNNISSHYSTPTTTSSVFTQSVISSDRSKTSPEPFFMSSNSGKIIFSAVQKSCGENVHPNSTHQLRELQSNAVHTTLSHNMASHRAVLGRVDSIFIKNSETSIEENAVTKNGDEGEITGRKDYQSSSSSSSSSQSNSDDRISSSLLESPKQKERITNGERTVNPLKPVVSVSYSSYHRGLHQYPQQLPPTRCQASFFSNGFNTTVKESLESHLPLEIHSNGNCGLANFQIRDRILATATHRLDSKPSVIKTGSAESDNKGKKQCEFHRSIYASGNTSKASSEFIEGNSSKRTDLKGANNSRVIDRAVWNDGSEPILLNSQENRTDRWKSPEVPGSQRFNDDMTHNKIQDQNDHKDHKELENDCSDKSMSLFKAVSNTDSNCTSFKANGQANLNFNRPKFPPVPQSNYDLRKQIYESMTRENCLAEPYVPPNDHRKHPFLSRLTVSGKSESFSKLCRIENLDAKQTWSLKLVGENAATSPKSNECCRDDLPHYRRRRASHENDRCTKYAKIVSGESLTSKSGFHESRGIDFDCRSSVESGLANREPSKSVSAVKEEKADIESDGFNSADSHGLPPPISSSPCGEKMTSLAVTSGARRESPLDLSVKTVRQTADSTARDDADTSCQNVGNFRGDSASPHAGSRLLVTNSGAPKIDFTPNFSGFENDRPGFGNSLRQISDFTVLPAAENIKKVSASDLKINISPPPYFSSSPTTGNKSQKDQSLTVQHSAEPVKIDTQKRQSNTLPQNHLSSAKVPKVDSWRMAFDQEIEQRLNSARVSFQNDRNAERSRNGVEGVDSSSVFPTKHSSVSENSVPAVERGNAVVYPQTPVQKRTVTPHNPNYVRQPHDLPATPQTPQEKLGRTCNVRNSPDPDQIIKQISKGVMPDYKLLQDKNVLSILRSSLEEKEAKLMKLREAARKKDHSINFSASDLPSKRFQPYDRSSRPENQNHKNGLPSFRDLTSERLCPSPSGHSLENDKSKESIESALERPYSGSITESEKNGLPSGDSSSRFDVQSSTTDLDGLAAFLAARIRTKGELKQVVPVRESELPGSCAKTNEASCEDCGLVETEKTSSLRCCGNPPKLIRETNVMVSSRRLFPNHFEIGDGVSSQENECSRPPHRGTNGIRSSSETSVFDFRDSDSEADMPVLERQTLEEMRRDRKSCGSKPSQPVCKSVVVNESVNPEILPELETTPFDSYWGTTFDMFVEELEKRPPKRSSRKKKLFSGLSSELSSEKNWEKSSAEQGDGEKTTECSAVAGMKKKETEFVEKATGDIVFEMKNSKCVGETVRNRAKSNSTIVGTHGKDIVSDLKIKPECGNLGISQERKSKSETSDLSVTEGKLIKKSTFVKKNWPNSKVPITDHQIKDGSTIGNDNTENVYDDIEGSDDDDDDDEDDDDDSLSLSGLESESSESGTSAESSNSMYASSEDFENDGLFKKKITMRTRRRTRLQTRSAKQKETKDTGMRLRSKALFSSGGNSKKPKKKRKEYYPRGKKKKKPPFGDGSAFRPGWEEECYKFKQQLRMPEKLISISRPPKGTSASLPDIEQGGNSSSRDSCEVSGNKKSLRGKSGNKNERHSTERSEAGTDVDTPTKPNQSSSILNLLVRKYGKERTKVRKSAKCPGERKSPRILPRGTNKPELLPTPGLGIGKENVLSNGKNAVGADESKLRDEKENPTYVGYFRKKTVRSFKDAFKENGALIPQQDFSPTVLESRTRRQARDLKKRATLIEVFGDERPASAPPLTRNGNAAVVREKPDESSKRKVGNQIKNGIAASGVVTRGKAVRSGRPGLRSAAVVRSNKALQLSKRHLNSGRKRSLDLLRMRALASKKKFSYLVKSSDGANQLPMSKKRLKLRSVRRKFRSGFDYIRKKKKLKKDGDSVEGSVKEKRMSVRPTSESVEDIQNEIKNWVINKGLGETVLHRAARLGYTDVAAYCLEKMGCSPSPRDNAGYTPLHEACSRGHLEVAKLLLMYGASVSESAKGGIRPLHEAAENGFTELIRLLLSFGADPLLETYTGHTALSLVTDEEARRLIQHHLADVQGNVAPMWTFRGPSSLFDPSESGYDPLSEPPSPEPQLSDLELEVSDTMLPPLYRLVADGEPDRHWILMTDLLSCTRLKSKDVLLKQLEASSVREMRASDFLDQGRCCSILGGDKPRTKAVKVVLVHYDEKIRRMLDVERVIL